MVQIIRVTHSDVRTLMNDVQQIVFKDGCFYIIWDDDTVSKYQYNWVENVLDPKYPIVGGR